MGKGTVPALTQNKIAQMLMKLMAQCYASGKEAIKNESTLAKLRIPVGFRAYTAKEGKWYCVDAYTVGEMGYSWGFVVLYYDGRPIFFMNFGGYVDLRICKEFGIDPKQVTTFLRNALLKQYSRWEEGKNAFLGCRGPIRFVDQGLVVGDNRRLIYHNSPRRNGVIHTVSGSDEINLFDPTGIEKEECLYRHDYLGGLLIKAG
jgi:hypothetical protein